MIELVVKLLRGLLADPSGLELEQDEDRPAVVGLDVPDWVVSKPFLGQNFMDAVMLGFRFLQVVVIDNTEGKKQLEARAEHEKVRVVAAAAHAVWSSTDCDSKTVKGGLDNLISVANSDDAWDDK